MNDPAHSPAFELRDVPPRVAYALEQAGVHPLLARLYAARGVRSSADVDADLAHLLPPATLQGAAQAAHRLAEAIEARERLCVVADYDCDGATACAVALRGLALLGADPATLHYVVPDRVRHGYGLGPAIVDLARERVPGLGLLLTVDNGIASVEGVAHARAHGVDVVVTDHHLPGAELPAAAVIVNPNQPGCEFASKALAGVGVMFYVLLALRAELRARARYAADAQPRLDALLDLVALGPRINAAGRLADMTLGIECLLTDDAARADELARTLDAINRERRDVESGMREQAELQLDALLPAGPPPAAIALYDDSFHEGVVGIVAGRLKDRLHRPTFVFARSVDGLLKGSGRSIPGFHLRDALDLVAKREAGVLLRFGGHAMAAGCTLAAAGFARFAAAFERVAAEWLDADTLQRRVRTDGPLPAEYYDAATVRALDAVVWGQAFEPPLFCDEVEVLTQRLVGERHLKLRLRPLGGRRADEPREAIWFGRSEPLPARARVAYRLTLDSYQGRERVQMVVEAAQAA